jgi:hypothetical protein
MISTGPTWSNILFRRALPPLLPGSAHTMHRMHVRYQNKTAGGAKALLRSLMSLKPSSKTGKKAAAADAHAPDQHSGDGAGHHPDGQKQQHEDVEGHGFNTDGGAHHGGGDDHLPEEYDPNMYDHPILLSEEEVKVRSVEAARSSSSALKENSADLLLDQTVLSPNVAQRLQVGSWVKGKSIA